jgi:hypothetical protein
MIFEAAVPPAVCHSFSGFDARLIILLQLFATLDLVLTQTLGSKLLWHLVVNYALAKLYVISFLYTVNSIGDYRAENRLSVTDNTKISLSNTTGRRPVGVSSISTQLNISILRSFS